MNTADRDDAGRPTYLEFWGLDRAGEKRAYEDLMDFFEAHLARYPGAHIYHYNHYEPTALEHLSEHHSAREDVLRRLMGRFASHEDDLDRMLRGRVFVDLYRVVRQGIRASVESYSIKRLEPFFGYEREVELEDVNERMVLFEIALDDGFARDDDETQRLIAGYNEDDCRATLGLRDWLEARRTELASELGADVPRPEAPEPEEDTTPPDVKELRGRLLDGLPEDEVSWSPEQRAKALMAELLEYHRREAKPAWWRHFHLRELTDEELLEERDAIAGLEFVEDLGKIKRSRKLLYRFPPQEHGFAEGSTGFDPATRKNRDVLEVDDAEGHLVLRLGPKAEHPHPTSLIDPGPQHNTTSQRESIRSLAERVADLTGSDWPHSSAFDLLLRRRPNADAADAEPLRLDDESALEAGRRLATGLDHSTLAVQGPPGTGKTFLGANQIVDLVGQGKKIGVTAMSHAVISNMLDEVHRVAADRGEAVRIGQRPGSEEHAQATSVQEEWFFEGTAAVQVALEADLIDVVGGTSWLWSNGAMEDAVHTLVVDEAGQMSLADVLACSRSAENLILLGDPMQLAHPGQGSHPLVVPESSLEHVLGDNATMPVDQGLFMDETRRMHPDITRFTSEVFYDGRLAGIRGLDQQEIVGAGPLTGSGLFFVPVPHEGNANASSEEAELVIKAIGELVACRWIDRDGVEEAMSMAGVLVVTPFNAQLWELQRAVEVARTSRFSAGTVDKFQGRQAPVVIYSMASSSAEVAPRGMGFLYDLHRLNVATSRAQAMAVVVANPDLTRVRCRTPQQMQLANALCRLVEVAKTVDVADVLTSNRSR